MSFIEESLYRVTEANNSKKINESVNRKSKKKLNESNDKVIMSSSLNIFQLVSKNGVGMNNTPWEALSINSLGLADKHVVGIELISNNPKFDGNPVQYKYTEAYVTHGMRGVIDSLKETEEYIKVLEEAVDFAKSLNEFLRTSDKWGMHN